MPLSFPKSLLEASILNQSQALGTNTTFALWLFIFEGLIRLLKGLVGFLYLVELLLLFLKLFFQLFGVREFRAANWREIAMRTGFRFCSRLSLFLAAFLIYDLDCVRCIAVIVNLNI